MAEEKKPGEVVGSATVEIRKDGTIIHHGGDLDKDSPLGKHIAMAISPRPLDK